MSPGVYVARVKSAQEAYSMKGDQMVEMEVAVGPNAEMKFVEKLYNMSTDRFKQTNLIVNAKNEVRILVNTLPI